MISKDTTTIQVLFIVSLFCAWNITSVEINSGVHLLKRVKSAKCLRFLPVVLVLRIWSCLHHITGFKSVVSRRCGEGSMRNATRLLLYLMSERVCGSCGRRCARSVNYTGGRETASHYVLRRLRSLSLTGVECVRWRNSHRATPASGATWHRSRDTRRSIAAMRIVYRQLFIMPDTRRLSVDISGAFTTPSFAAQLPRLSSSTQSLPR